MGYLDRLSRSILFARLKELQDGRLTVQDSLGISHFGNQLENSASSIQILDPKVYRRVVTGGGLGAADAFVDGMWRTENLVSVLRLFARNLDQPRILPQLFSPLSFLGNRVRQALQKILEMVVRGTFALITT